MDTKPRRELKFTNYADGVAIVSAPFYLRAAPSRLGHRKRYPPHSEMPEPSDSYRWINANIDSLLETPDEGFDWIFMLTDSDWELLDASWESRTAPARESIAYIVSDGPAVQSRSILLRALRDSNPAVAGQAAESLRCQRVLAPDSFPPLDAESADMVESLLANDEP